MKEVVVDASAVLSWLLPSQATPASIQFLWQAEQVKLLAQRLTEYEIRNVLLRAERRAGSSPGIARTSLQLCEGLGVVLDRTPGRARLAIPLLSRDRNMIEACEGMGVLYESLLS